MLAVAQAPHAASVTVAGPLEPRARQRLARAGVRWVVLPVPATPTAPGFSTARGQLRRLLRDRSISVLHAHGEPALQLAAAALSLRSPRPVPPLVATLPRAPEPVTSFRLRLARLLGRPSPLSVCAAIILPSQADQADLRDTDPRAAQRVSVIYPALELAGRPSGAETGILRKRLGLSGQAAVVGLVTDFTDGSAPAFLHAAGRVHSALPNVEFAFLGEGPGRAEAAALAHNLQLTGVTVFLGQPAGFADALSTLNVLVLLTDARNSLLHALQALDYGITVIGANRGALRELLTSLPNTRLVDPGDAAELATALQSALHLIPDAAEADRVDTVRGAPAPLAQLLVSRDFYDLDRPWSAGSSTGGLRSSQLRQALQRFSPSRVADQVWQVYRDVLGVR